MTPVLRRAMPYLLATMAVASSGCTSKSERTPTGPQAAASGEEGRPAAMAVRAPYLGTAANFAVLAGTPSITCTGASLITGDVGISPAAAIIGFPAPCTNVGTLHAADATAVTAKADLVTAYNTLDAQTCSSTVGPNLAGLTLVPGVYCVGGAPSNLTGTLILDAQGNPNAVWVFKMSSSLITSPGSIVSVINGGSPCGVQWLVRSSATIDTGTRFVGNIVALTSIVMNTGANLTGRALARNATVTLDTNNVSFAACGVTGAPPPFPTPTPAPSPSPGPTPTPGPGPSPVPALPVAAMWGLLAVLMATGAYILSRH